ncbi:glycosyltransferase family 2 protein [Mucilaginibacter sp.]|uniref:glycosyltransferase family 2 protein n=1 Tax=Mucilaginibacter sp. TaxID=1882438 RepID=UPI0035BC7734
MVKVSVIVPNYNHAPYLTQRINSILAQTCQDFELIILDDQSTDDSRQVIEKFRNHSKISHILLNEKNSGGPFYQWNKGIELATGEYVWIAESDDWCEPTLLEVLLIGVAGNDKCTLAYAQTHTVDDAGNILQTSVHNKLEEYVDGQTYIKSYLADHCSIWNASMLIFRKASFEHVSKRFMSFKMSGDWMFYTEMAKQGDVFISGRVLNYFRNHDKDVSGKMYSTGSNYLEELEILNIMLTDGLLNQTEFKEHLLQKFIRYTVAKFRFSDDMKTVIEAAFFESSNGQYRSYLQLNSRLRLLRIRLSRRLNRLFE